MANVPERRVVVVHPRVDEASTGGGAARAASVRDRAKRDGETAQQPKPWPVEFGWDFPFDFPKPSR